MQPLSLYLLVALGAAVAGFVQGLSGFAFGLVAMSIWALTVEPKLAAVLATFGALTGQLIAAFSQKRSFDKRLLLPFVVGGLAGVPLGVWLLPRLDVAVFKACLGALLVIWCPAMLAVAFALHLVADNVGLAMLPMLAIVAGCVLVPVLLGARLYVGISDVAFRQIVLGLLTVSGVMLLVSSLPTLLQR